MKIIYRISDKGNEKNKPSYITKHKCFLHFLSVFKNNDIYIVADNVCEKTYILLSAYIEPSKIYRTSSYNSASFLYSVDLAIQLFPNEEEKVYLAEDDYVYLPIAPQVIEEGLQLADYSSGYDHPDKYMNHSEGGPNPFIEKGGELSRVMKTNNRHWKFTNSCCMTFATTIGVLKRDREIYAKYCQERNPSDFSMFCDLLKNHDRTLVSCLPGVSTHGEIEWMSPFVNWEQVMQYCLW